MICDRVLGNIADVPANSPAQEQDAVELSWIECPRRALRKRTRAGRQVAVLLPPGQVLRHGDILFEEPLLRIIVEVIRCRVLVARPKTPGDLATLAFEIGNLHLPVEIDHQALVVAPDGPVEEILERLGIEFVSEVRRFSPIFSAAGGAVTLAPGLQVVRRSGGS